MRELKELKKRLEEMTDGEMEEYDFGLSYEDIYSFEDPNEMYRR